MLDLLADFLELLAMIPRKWFRRTSGPTSKPSD
jgi:hypothetical protein